MFLPEVGSENQALIFQPLSSTGHVMSGSQKTTKGGEDEKKVEATSAAVQDRITLSREAQTLASQTTQNQKGANGKFQEAPSPFDR